MNPEKKSPDYFLFHNKLLISVLILPFLLQSCVTQRDLKYVKDISNTKSSYTEATFTEYRVKPNDALYIQINSLDDVATNVFAQSGTQQALEPYGAYMNSFTVDKQGFVVLPIIGKINVVGKTTAEVGYIIKDSVTNILKFPNITVKLVNQYVSVLGEVRSPGHFVYSQDKLTIFNAIGLAGDITDYGNRKNVTLIRSENGNNMTINLDLTKADILSSPYYYVQPNDFIYVSPLRKRFWGIREFPFTVIFSTITTAIVVYTFVKQEQQP